MEYKEIVKVRLLNGVSYVKVFLMDVKEMLSRRSCEGWSGWTTDNASHV
jgi:hypothetical protein